MSKYTLLVLRRNKCTSEKRSPPGFKDRFIACMVRNLNCSVPDTSCRFSNTRRTMLYTRLETIFFNIAFYFRRSITMWDVDWFVQLGIKGERVQDQIVKAGEDIMLQVDFEGNPRPAIKWTVDDRGDNIIRSHLHWRSRWFYWWSRSGKRRNQMQGPTKCICATRQERQRLTLLFSYMVTILLAILIPENELKWNPKYILW